MVKSFWYVSHSDYPDDTVKVHRVVVRYDSHHNPHPSSAPMHFLCRKFVPLLSLPYRSIPESPSSRLCWRVSPFHLTPSKEISIITLVLPSTLIEKQRWNRSNGEIYTTTLVKFSSLVSHLSFRWMVNDLSRLHRRNRAIMSVRYSLLFWSVSRSPLIFVIPIFTIYISTSPRFESHIGFRPWFSDHPWVLHHVLGSNHTMAPFDRNYD